MTRRDATHSRPQPLTPRLASAHPAPSVCLELDSCGHCLPSHTPWSQPRTALPHPTPRSHVGDAESLPQAFSCPDAPSRGAWVPSGPGGPIPQHTQALPPPLSLDRGTRGSRPGPRSCRAAHLSLPCTVRPGAPTGGDSDNCSPGHTSRTLAVAPLSCGQSWVPASPPAPSVLGPAISSLSQQRPAPCQLPPAGLLCGLGRQTPCTPLPDLGGLIATAPQPDRDLGCFKGCRPRQDAPL